MSARSRPIVVGVDGSRGANAALRWAAAEAAATDRTLRLVYAYRQVRTRIPGYTELPDMDVRASRDAAEQLLEAAVARAYATEPRIDVDADAASGDPARVLLGASEFAAELVLGSRRRKTLGSTVLGSVSGAVAARAACPTVVVRGPAGGGKESTVVVGVDGTDAADAVLDFGFAHASRWQVPLRVVLCWQPRSIWHVDAPEQRGSELSGTLAGWRLKYPDVSVHLAVIREHPLTGLMQLSQDQRLLVVGTRGRHARTGSLLGSVSQGVLHHSTCPVAVVPITYGR